MKCQGRDFQRHLYCLFPFSSKALDDTGTLWKKPDSLNYYVKRAVHQSEIPTMNCYVKNKILLYEANDILMLLVVVLVEVCNSS